MKPQTTICSTGQYISSITPGWGAAIEGEVAVDQAPDAAERGVHASARAMSRKTCSRSSRPKRATNSAGEALVDHPALLQHEHMATEPFHLRHVVAGEQDGAAGLRAITLQPGPHPVACIGVQAGGGSSNSRSCGRLISALAKATRVFWPAESSPAGRLRKSPICKVSVNSAIRALGPSHIVEMAVDPQVFRHLRRGGKGRV